MFPASILFCKILDLYFITAAATPSSFIVLHSPLTFFLQYSICRPQAWLKAQWNERKEFDELQGAVDQSPLCHFKKVFHISDSETCARLHELVMSFGVQTCFLGNALFLYASAFLLFYLWWQWEEKCCCGLFCKCSLLLGMGQPLP